MPTEYGCIFCNTGRERCVVAALADKGIQAIFPVKQYRYRKQGSVSIEKKPLFPGYVFFVGDPAAINPQDLRSPSGVIKILKSGDERGWPLIGGDRAMAKALFDNGGEVGFSPAYYEGDRIIIKEGFLKDYEGEIKRVNRRAGMALVELKIGDAIFRSWLGFTLIDVE